jgi:hypothetical protein
VQAGGCLCGRVRYRVTAESTDVINCHCKFCQRATGGAYLVESLFSKEDFETTKGNTRIYEHISEGSGKTIHVNFCESCGTKLFLTFERFPATVGVYSGTFDDPDWFSRTPDNTQYFFLSEAPNGTIIPAGFEIFHEHYWESEGVASTPQTFKAHTVVSSEVKEVSKSFASEHRHDKSE